MLDSFRRRSFHDDDWSFLSSFCKTTILIGTNSRSRLTHWSIWLALDVNHLCTTCIMEQEHSVSQVILGILALPLRKLLPTVFPYLYEISLMCYINTNLHVLQQSLFSIFQLPIMHSVCPPNFAYTIVVECSWEYAELPRKFHNNSSCKIWGANRVQYGPLENREFAVHILTLVFF